MFTLHCTLYRLWVRYSYCGLCDRITTFCVSSLTSTLALPFLRPCRLVPSPFWSFSVSLTCRPWHPATILPTSSVPCSFFSPSASVSPWIPSFRFPFNTLPFSMLAAPCSFSSSSSLHSLQLLRPHHLPTFPIGLLIRLYGRLTLP